MGAHSDDEEEEELDEILGDDTGRSDLGGNPDKKDKKEKEDKKDESVSLKGMTKAELTEAIKEIIKQKLNK
jgi:phosphopantothenoylcysteine synthetase/decarboxylase